MLTRGHGLANRSWDVLLKYPLLDGFEVFGYERWRVGKNWNAGEDNAGSYGCSGVALGTRAV